MRNKSNQFILKCGEGMVSGNFALDARLAGGIVDLTVVFKEKRSVMGLYH